MLNSLYMLAQAATDAAAPAPAAPAAPGTPAAPVDSAAPAAAPGGLMDLLSSPMVMLVLFIVIFWVLIIRPQRKAAKEHQAKLQQIERGDKVITNAGIHGTVEHVGDTTVNIKVADGVILKLEKAAITYFGKKD